jgi:hypothetical protein
MVALSHAMLCFILICKFLLFKLNGISNQLESYRTSANQHQDVATLYIMSKEVEEEITAVMADAPQIAVRAVLYCGDGLFRSLSVCLSVCLVIV